MEQKKKELENQFELVKQQLLALEQEAFRIQGEYRMLLKLEQEENNKVEEPNAVS